MKLTRNDKIYLLKIGYLAADFDQIERAGSKTVYEMDGKRIKRVDVISRLGREKYISGLARSAFHWSACRETDDGSRIFFYSHKLFT